MLCTQHSNDRLRNNGFQNEVEFQLGTVDESMTQTVKVRLGLMEFTFELTFGKSFTIYASCLRVLSCDSGKKCLI